MWAGNGEVRSQLHSPAQGFQESRACCYNVLYRCEAQAKALGMDQDAINLQGPAHAPYDCAAARVSQDVGRMSLILGRLSTTISRVDNMDIIQPFYDSSFNVVSIPG